MRVKQVNGSEKSWLPQKPNRESKYFKVHFHVFSDLHYGKVITRDESLNTEEYDREIARQRLKNAAKYMLMRSLEEKVDHIFLLFLGDMVDGDIHKDAMAIQGGIANLREEIENVFKKVLSAYAHVQEKYKIPVEVHAVVGNHGRYTKKFYTKTAIYNFEYELFRSLKNYFHRSFTNFMVYEQIEGMLTMPFDPTLKVLITHKQNSRSYFGVPWTSLVNVLFKKFLMLSNNTQNILGAIIGHWHTPGFYTITQNGHFVVINGAFYTVDAFARMKGLSNPSVQTLLKCYYLYEDEGISIYDRETIGGRIRWQYEMIHVR